MDHLRHRTAAKRGGTRRGAQDADGQPAAHRQRLPIESIMVEWQPRPVELLDFTFTGGAYAIDTARRVLGYQPEDSCVDAWAGLYEWWLARPR